jgi:hypothetical protein
MMWTGLGRWAANILAVAVFGAAAPSIFAAQGADNVDNAAAGS